jgi:hypothetical protein
MAISQPPPRQAPSIAATVVCGSFASFVNVFLPEADVVLGLSAPLTVVNSETSAPAM